MTLVIVVGLICNTRKFKKSDNWSCDIVTAVTVSHLIEKKESCYDFKIIAFIFWHGYFLTHITLVGQLWHLWHLINEQNNIWTWDIVTAVTVFTFFWKMESCLGRLGCFEIVKWLSCNPCHTCRSFVITLTTDKWP